MIGGRNALPIRPRALTAEEVDEIASACETPTERLAVWTLLDTGLRVGELCDLTSKTILWRQRQLRVKGKGGPHGKKSKVGTLALSALHSAHWSTPVRPSGWPRRFPGRNA